MKKTILSLIVTFSLYGLNAQTWQGLTPNQNSSFMDLAILDQNTCFAVGWKGAIFKTEDGGNTWQQVSNGTSENMTSVCAINGVVYATAESGKILRCSDRTTWTEYTVNESLGNDVYFYNSHIGFVSGRKGLIGKTTDGGASWQAIQTNFKGLIRKVQFVSETEGFAIGIDNNANVPSGKILKTTDGGSTWNIIYEADNMVLNDLHFASNTLGFVVGRNGTILKTTNGTSFTTLNSNTTKELNSVTFTDQYVGYAVGTKGAILKTMNGGATWQTLTSPKEYKFISCEFQGNTGYILMAGNLILKTTNGGN